MKPVTLWAAAGLCLAFGAVPLYAQAPTVFAAGNPGRGAPYPPARMVLPDCPASPLPGNGTPGVPNPAGEPNPAGQPNPANPTDATGTGDAFAQAPEGGTQAAASFDPGLFGDLIGVNGQRVILLPPGVTAHGNFKVLGGNRIAIIAPLPSRGVFKITENEGPRPTDRVFFNYNYFNNVDRLLQGIPGTAADLHRETIGFEKTLLQGDASFGVRLPYLQLTGSKDFEDSHVGDLSLIFKYAFINNRTTGDVLSGGLVLTAPTGQEITVEGESSINSTVFQPFVGFIYHINRDVYFQGFSSLAVPTDARDVTLLFNSIAAGYHLYRAEDPDAILRGVVPVAEIHINTPLNHRGLYSAPLGFSDSVNFTGGAYIQFRRATLGIAAGTPLTGPKPYDLEVSANLNFHF